MSSEPVPDNTVVDLRTRITDMVSLTEEAFAVMEELKQSIYAILASKHSTSRKITKKATICQKSLSNIAKIYRDVSSSTRLQCVYVRSELDVLKSTLLNYIEVGQDPIEKKIMEVESQREAITGFGRRFRHDSDLGKTISILVGLCSKFSDEWNLLQKIIQRKKTTTENGIRRIEERMENSNSLRSALSEKVLSWLSPIKDSIKMCGLGAPQILDDVALVLPLLIMVTGVFGMIQQKCRERSVAKNQTCLDILNSLATIEESDLKKIIACVEALAKVCEYIWIPFVDMETTLHHAAAVQSAVLLTSFFATVRKQYDDIIGCFNYYIDRTEKIHNRADEFYGSFEGKKENVTAVV